MTRHPCPPTHRWAALLTNDVPPADEIELNGHLELCPACQRTLEDCAAHRDAWALTAKSLGQPGPTREQALRDVIDQLKIDPESDHDSSDGAELPLDFLDPPSEPPGSSRRSLGRIHQYEVLEEVGRGGMGVVLKALDPGLHRVVAIKVLAPQLAVSGTARKRFTREARAAAAVGHENVVTIHAVEEFKGLPYLVMQYIAGPSVQQRLADGGPLPVAEILRIGFQTAAGLAAAHAQGLIHRDVKPANILLENGVERVKLTDFSLARAIDDASVTQTGVVTGTPPYMAPEQARGEPLDHRADLFSLGSVMYALCTGRAPFRGQSLDVLRRVSEETPTPIRTLNPEIPAWLEGIVMKLMAKNPEERFQSAGKVSALLERCLAHVQQPTLVPLPAVPGTTESRARSKRRSDRSLRARLFIGLVAAAAILLAVTVLRIRANNGTLEITLDDPNATVTVDGTDIVVSGITGVKEFRLKAGDYAVHQTKDGKPEKTEVVSIKQGEKTPLRVTFEGDVATARKAEGIPEAKLAGDLDIYRRMGRTASGIPQPQRTFPTAADKISSAVFSRDGKNLFVADWGGTVYSYDFASGKVRFTLAPGKDGENRFLAVSPDDKYLVAVGAGSTIQFIDHGKVRQSLAGKCDPYYAVAFTADGKTLAAGGADPKGGGLLELWDIDSGKVRTMNFADPVRSLAFPPGRDDRLAVGTDGGNVRINDSIAAKELFSIRKPGPFRALAISPDGRSLAAPSGDGRVDRWNMVDWRAANHRGIDVFTGHTGRVTTIQFSPDGNRILSASIDGTAKLWDAHWDGRTSKCVATLAPGTYKTGMAAALFTPDGTSIVTAGDDGMIRVWDVASTVGKTAATSDEDADFRKELEVKKAMAAERSRRLAAEATVANKVGDGMQATHPQGTFQAGAGGPILSAAFAPDGHSFFVAGEKRPIQRFDLQNGAAAGATTGQWGDAPLVAVAPDGVTIATANGHSVSIYGPMGKRLNEGFAQVASIYALAFGPEGKTLAIGGRTDQGKGFVQLWSPDTGFWGPGTGAGRRIDFPVAVLSLAFDFGNQSRLAVGLNTDNIRMVDTKKAEVIYTLPQSGPIDLVAFSPDAKWLAAAEGANQVRLWDWQTSRMAAVLTGHTDRVTSVRFSRDNQWVATASLDGTARLWDVRTRRTVMTFAPNAGKLYVAEFTPDGRSLMTAGADREIRFWDLPPPMGGPVTPEPVSAVPPSQPVRTIQTDAGGPILTAAFSKDGTSLVIAGEDQTVRVYDVAADGHCYNYKGKDWHGPPVLAMAPDGNMFAMAGDGEVVNFWYVHGVKDRLPDLSTGVPTIHALAVSPDGKTLAVGGKTADGKGVVALCDLQTGKVQSHEFQSAVLSLAFDPGARMRLAIGLEKGNVQVIHATTGKFVCTTHVAGPTAHMAFSPEGKWFAATQGDSTFVLQDWNGGDVVARITPTAGRITSIRFSPDGKRLATASTDGTARLWDVPTGRGVTSFSPNAGKLYVAEFSPDGKSLITAGENREIRFWDLTPFIDGKGSTPPTPTDPKDIPAGPAQAKPGDDLGLDQLREYHERFLARQRAENIRRNAEAFVARAKALSADQTFHKPQTIIAADNTDAVSSAVFSRYSELLVVAGLDGSIHAYDLFDGTKFSGKKRYTIAGKSGENRLLAVSPDGKLLAAGGNGTVKLFDIKTGKQVRASNKQSAAIRSLAFSPDSRGLVVGEATDHGGQLEFWDLDFGELGPALRFDHPVPAVAYAPVGFTVAAAIGNGEVEVISAPGRYTGYQPTYSPIILKHASSASAVAFSEDGKTLAVAIGSEVKLWDWKASKELATLSGHTDRVTSVQFIQNQLLATASLDGTAKLWAAATGQLVATFAPERPAGKQYVAAYSPIGMLATAGEDRIIRLWTLIPLLIGEKVRDSSMPPADNVKIPSIQEIKPDDLAGRTPTQVAVTTIQARHAKAEEIAPEVKKFLGPVGTVSLDARTNSFVVQDTIENLRAVVKRIAEIDGPAGDKQAPKR